MSLTPREGKMAAAPISALLWNVSKKAVKSKGLERSLKMAIPKEVYEALEKEMGQIGQQ